IKQVTAPEQPEFAKRIALRRPIDQEHDEKEGNEAQLNEEHRIALLVRATPRIRAPAPVIAARRRVRSNGRSPSARRRHTARGSVPDSKRRSAPPPHRP